MLDLFDHVPSTPLRDRRALPKVAAPPFELASLSDARLARLLVEVTTEVERRKTGTANPQSRPEIEQAIREAARLLRAMLPKRAGQAKRSPTSDSVPALQEGKRKAIRTALQAGVSPGQVARHFGLSLAAVRKVLAEAE